MLLKICNNAIFESNKIEKVQLPTVFSPYMKTLFNAYSTNFTDGQKTALNTFVDTVKSNSTLASKIKKMYMPMLSSSLDDVRINVADYLNNDTITVDAFTGTWNSTNFTFAENGGMYSTASSLSTLYTSTGVAGMSNMKMNNWGLINVLNKGEGGTNGTRLTSTGGGCFFLRNWSNGNKAVQGAANGTTGKYCGQDISELYGVPAGYFQNKTTAPCIDMLMFSENQLLGLEGTASSVQTYDLKSDYTDTININMQDKCYFSTLIPTATNYTNYGTVNYMILITEALTADEMIALRDAIDTFVDYYFA